jgi:hypothetical protein
MDEQTATRLAAQQLVDQLGKAAGFMIALRIMQVLAERTSPVTPELIEAFAVCLRGMERFATMAGLDQGVDPASQVDTADAPAVGGGGGGGGAPTSSGAAAPGGSADGASNGGAGSGVSDPLKGLAEALGVGNGRGGWGGNGTPLA